MVCLSLYYTILDEYFQTKCSHLFSQLRITFVHFFGHCFLNTLTSQEFLLHITLTSGSFSLYFSSSQSFIMFVSYTPSYGKTSCTIIKLFHFIWNPFALYNIHFILKGICHFKIASKHFLKPFPPLWDTFYKCGLFLNCLECVSERSGCLQLFQ